MGKTHRKPKPFHTTNKTYQAVGSWENDRIPPTEHQKVQPPTYQEAEECARNA